jgi:plastocyanin
LLAVAAGAALLPAAAQADQRIEAATRDRYAATTVSIDQGERLTFRNGDLSGHSHDVTAKDPGPGGGPLFSSRIAGPGEEVSVDGSQYLTTGSYEFYCSIHSFMRGQLNVTANGTPVPRPGGGEDRVPPDLSIALRRASLRKLVRSKRIVVRTSLDEAATLKLRGVLKRGRRRATIATRTLRLDRSGTRAVSLRLTRGGRKLLRGRSSALIEVRARATDAAGNRSLKRAARRYRT